MIDVYASTVNGTWYGLAYRGDKIVATTAGDSRERTIKKLLRSLPPNTAHRILERGSNFAEDTLLKLDKAHRGTQDFDDPTLDADCVPEPLASVLKTAASIPVGYVASYGSIAEIAGTDARTVGQIMASNPLYPIVPCHRVVGSDFSLVGYGGGKSPSALKVKLNRLSAECKGFVKPKEMMVLGKMFTVYPTERVIEKARKRDLTVPGASQPTLLNY